MRRNKPFEYRIGPEWNLAIIACDQDAHDMMSSYIRGRYMEQNTITNAPQSHVSVNEDPTTQSPQAHHTQNSNQPQSQQSNLCIATQIQHPSNDSSSSNDEELNEEEEVKHCDLADACAAPNTTIVAARNRNHMHRYIPRRISDIQSDQTNDEGPNTQRKPHNERLSISTPPLSDSDLNASTNNRNYNTDVMNIDDILDDVQSSSSSHRRKRLANQLYDIKENHNETDNDNDNDDDDNDDNEDELQVCIKNIVKKKTRRIKFRRRPKYDQPFPQNSKFTIGLKNKLILTQAFKKNPNLAKHRNAVNAVASRTLLDHDKIHTFSSNMRIDEGIANPRGGLRGTKKTFDVQKIANAIAGADLQNIPLTPKLPDIDFL